MSDIFIPAIIDVEASGFGLGSYPIEVGVALADGKTHCFLIKPEPRWTHWDPKAEQAHGISREILANHGKSPYQVADSLNELLAGQTLYSDAWGYDNTWIALLFDAAELPQTFKVAQLQGLFQEAHYDLWNPAYTRLQQELGISRHRASSDAYLIQQTFIQTSLAVKGRT